MWEQELTVEKRFIFFFFLELAPIQRTGELAIARPPDGRWPEAPRGRLLRAVLGLQAWVLLVSRE